jgi:uncharacterized protein (DUF488 family)
LIEQVLTIGAYGFNELTFIEALKSARVDLFVDIRARRGMRGSAYAFANASRLQVLLESAAIRYTHAKELAPTEQVRDAQRAADSAAGVAKRDRTRLGSAFVSAYERDCLATFQPDEFFRKYVGDAKRPVLFCVEREAEACHRSIVAPRLAAAMAVPVLNLKPGPTQSPALLPRSS